MVDKKKEEEKKQYKSSFGATLLFSGVQFYQILIRVIKSKFVALFLGPAGMGISSLLHSTTDTIAAATNLGLSTSSVKTIAAANREGNKELIAKNITALRRLIWITGIVGMLACAILSPIWSHTSFGNSDYILSFILVSVIILLDQLNKGELALLQGMQEKKKLAKANMIGQTLNALLTVPLYYFFGLKAIVAALVLGSLISFSVSSFFSHNLKIQRVNMTLRETFNIGREMVKLGFFLSLQFLLLTVTVLIIRNYVSCVGGVEDVGLYSAGTNIVTTYIGLVFSAIATDYFPRLAATKNNEEMSLAVGTQAELTMLLLAPLLVAFIVFCKPVIILLYSNQFLPIEHMMYWAVGATLFQAMGWAVSYTLLAKAKPSTFFINELVATAYTVPLKIYGYSVLGLTGFGIATLIGYILYLIQVLIVAKRLFDFTYNSQIWPLFILLNSTILATAILNNLLAEIWGYIIGCLVLFLTTFLVLRILNRKMNLLSVVQSKFRK